MAQDTNHILQSFTDVLVGSNQEHIYHGKAPIHVDNATDEISLDPIAKTVIEPTNTVFVEPGVNALGNTTYKLHVSHDAGKSYNGIYPVQVDNNRNQIGVNNVNLDLQFPLFGSVDDETLTIGSKFGQYYDGSNVNEINYMEYWNEQGTDKFIRLRHDGQLDPISFGYLLPSLPASGSDKYVFGGDRQWHQEAPATMVYMDTIDVTATVDLAQGYQEFDFGEILECNTFEVDYTIFAVVAGLTAVSVFNGTIETIVNNTSLGNKYFQVVNGLSDMNTQFYSNRKLGSYASIPSRFRLKVRVYNAANTWKDNSIMSVTASVRRYVWNT